MTETENTGNRVPRTAANSGVTLIELLYTVVILAILAAVAIPNFRTFTRSSQVTSAANDLVTALNLARSEAMTRGTPATVCISNDQANCTPPAVPPDQNWHQGWIVFIDAMPPLGTVDAGEEIIRVYAAPGGNVTMVGVGGENRITYNPSGYLTDIALSGTVQVVSADGSRRIDINTSASGRVNSQRQ